jgi:hypothetical protein
MPARVLSMMGTFLGIIEMIGVVWTVCAICKPLALVVESWNFKFTAFGIGSNYDGFGDMQKQRE